MATPASGMYIIGYTRDETGAAIASVNISAYNNGTAYTGTSDGTGYFLVGAAAPYMQNTSLIRVNFTKTGYRPYNATIDPSSQPVMMYLNITMPQVSPSHTGTAITGVVREGNATGDEFGYNITNGYGAPVAGVTVTVVDSVNGGMYNATTNAYGYYQIDSPEMNISANHPYDVWIGLGQTYMDSHYTAIAYTTSITQKKYYMSACNVIDGDTMLSPGGSVLGLNIVNSTLKSYDGGVHWSYVSDMAKWSRRNRQSCTLGGNGRLYLAAGYTGSGQGLHDVYMSLNDGQSWTTMNAAATWLPRTSAGITVSNTGRLLISDGIKVGNGTTGCQYDLWYSDNNGTSWTAVPSVPWWNESTTTGGQCQGRMTTLSDGTIIHISGLSWGLWPGFDSNKVWASTDNGATWTEKSGTLGALIASGFNLLHLSDDTLVVAGGDAYDPDVYISTDDGSTWSLSGSTIPHRSYESIVADSDDRLILYGGFGYEVYNNGTGCAYVNSTNVALGDIWYSSDRGATWYSDCGVAP